MFMAFMLVYKIIFKPHNKTENNNNKNHNNNKKLKTPHLKKKKQNKTKTLRKSPEAQFKCQADSVIQHFSTRLDCGQMLKER